MGKSITLTSKDSEGNPKTVIIKKPNHKQMSEAQFYAATVFNKARDSGMILKANLNAWLEEQKLFTKEDRMKVRELELKLAEGEKALTTKKHADGRPVKLSEGRQIAVDMNIARTQLRLLDAKRQSYDEFTVEGTVENARFDYLVSACVFDEEGKLVFTDVDDYYDRKDEPFANDAAYKLMVLVFGVDEDWQKKTVENEFLLKYKFVNEDLNFVDKDGNLVNAKGDKITKEDETPVETEPVSFVDDVYT